jgi:hypothetical protein
MTNRKAFCQVISCEEPATYFQLVECDATRYRDIKRTIRGRATIAELCEEHSRTERASRFSIDNSSQVLKARRRTT